MGGASSNASTPQTPASSSQLYHVNVETAAPAVIFVGEADTYKNILLIPAIAHSIKILNYWAAGVFFLLTIILIILTIMRKTK